MTVPSKSYERVAYDLRPAKQVERRMLLDALGRLMNGGVPIRDYQYTGLGSIYFFDFLLLYKLVGIRRFLTSEYDTSIEKRILFNMPFGGIEVRMDPIGDVIPDLSPDLSHLLWLDYDSGLVRSMLEDAASAAFQLSPGSILLVTVDAEPPKGTDDPSSRLAYFQDEGGEYLPFDFDREWCRLSELPETNLKILETAIRSGLAFRSDVAFFPLFKFVYADGHEMVTLGGMIGGETEKRKLDGCDWENAKYLRKDTEEDAYRIVVPRLTRKERMFLDRYMPTPDSWSPSEFEIKPDVVEAYRDIHRYYPHYGEFFV